MTDFADVFAVTAVLVLAGIVKGATGIGYATCAIPMLAQFIGLKPAIALSIAPTLAANVAATFSSGSIRTTLRAFAPLYVAAVPGVGIGLMAMMCVDPAVAVSCLGAMMAIYALFSLFNLRFVISEPAGQRLRIPIGFLGGVLAGLTGSQVVPLVPYILALEMNEKQTMQAINLGVLTFSVAIGLAMLATHTIEPAVMAGSLLAIAPALIGAAIGCKLQTRMQASTLRRLILVVIGLSGLKLAIL